MQWYHDPTKQLLQLGYNIQQSNIYNLSYQSLDTYLEVEKKYFNISAIIKWSKCFDFKCSKKRNQKVATELVKEN